MRSRAGRTHFCYLFHMLRLIVLLIAAGCAHVVPEGAEVRQRSLLAAGDADAALAAMDAELRALGGRPGGPSTYSPPRPWALPQEEPPEGFWNCFPDVARQHNQAEWAKTKAAWRPGQPASQPGGTPNVPTTGSGP